MKRKLLNLHLLNLDAKKYVMLIEIDWLKWFKIPPCYIISVQKFCSIDLFVIISA